MNRLPFALTILLTCVSTLVRAEPLRALAGGALPNDVRLAAPKDLNGYFPFSPPDCPEPPS